MTLLAQVIVTALVLSFLTQLAVRDRILEAPRERLLNRLHSGGMVRQFFGDMLSCHRCAGVWLAPLATVIVIGELPWENWRLFVITAMAASYLQFVVMQYADTLETRDEE